MTFKFTVSDVIPAKPTAVYDAWLDGKLHGKMTGAKATGSAKVGAKFSAWDGYIKGTNLELVRRKRIVQSWRTVQFAETDKDSKITLTLKPVTGGTNISLLHTSVPDGQTGYKDGWRENYFEPMKAYFAKETKKKEKEKKKPKSK